MRRVRKCVLIYFLLPAMLVNIRRTSLISLLSVLLLAVCGCAYATTYYVSTTGNDSNAGTSLDAPFKTIQKAMNTAVAGDTVIVRGGTYREDVEVTHGGTASAPIILEAYPGEIPVIKGSDVVTGWTQYNANIWKKTGWPYNSQQVFVDFDSNPGNSLQQIGMPSQYYNSWEYPNPVGTGLSSMTPGSFYYDPSTQTLYVWLADGSDPNKHVMEASVRRRLLFLHQPYVDVKGFAFRHSNTSAFTQQGAAVSLSSNSVIQDCDIEYTDFAGLSMGYLQNHAQAENCTISHNGDSGILAAGSTDFRVTNVTLSYNNTRNFNPLWHAGGLKAASGAFGIVQKCKVAYNNGSGIWFDYANSNGQIVIRDNFVYDNGPVDSAIFFEVSNNGLIYNNVLVDNRRRGIYLSASNNTRVYNNTIVGTKNRAGIELGGMPRGSATLMNNAVYNNIISDGTSEYDLYIMPDNGSTITGNTSDYNDIYRASGSIDLWSGSSYYDLASWCSATGLDTHSISADPEFVSAAGAPGSATSYEVDAGSPVIDAGFDLGSAVPDDYLGVTRPSGSAYDIGAFEYVESSTTNTSTSTTTTTQDTTAPVVTIDNSVTHGAGSVKISASATDNVGVTGMSIYIDGSLMASSTDGQISYHWKHPPSGSHSLRVTATDAAGNMGTATGTVTIQ